MRLLIAIYLFAAIWNVVLFAKGGGGEHLAIAGLFVVVAAQTRTIEKWKRIAGHVKPVWQW